MIELENCPNRKDLTVHWVRRTHSSVTCSTAPCGCTKEVGQQRSDHHRRVWEESQECPVNWGDRDSQEWRVSPQSENKANSGLPAATHSWRSPEAPWEGGLPETLNFYSFSLRLEGANWMCFYSVLKTQWVPVYSVGASAPKNVLSLKPNKSRDEALLVK